MIMAKILVIEDETQLSELLKKMLTRDGHQVFIAHDGIEGIKNFNQSKPDLIITDIIMHEKDGTEVIVELLKNNPELAIIAISGGCRTLTPNFNLNLAAVRGVKGVLQKPFTFEKLKEMIEQVLS